MKKFYNVFITVILITVLLGGLFCGYWTMRPTRAVTEDDGYQRFLSDIEAISKEKHPSNSPAIQKVREYLVQEFDKIGCTYETDSFIVKNEFSKNFNLTNFLVKLDAKDTDTGVMFVSHYDSVNSSFGAGDDGVGVAAMLETIRQMSDTTDLKNDIYFLFTDGEEQWMLGAKYFTEKYMEYKDKIKLVVNLEARGNEGTLLMFETSDNNKAIIQMLNNALSDITAFSFSAAVYKTMPNNTDLTEFFEEGYPGINFAVVDGGENYHTAMDNFENLDRDTAYMFYKTTKELATYLSNADLNNFESSENAVYFPMLKGNIVIVSQTLTVVGNIFLLISTLGLFIYLFLKKRVSYVKTMFSLFGTIVSICAGVGFVWLLNKLANSSNLFGELTSENVFQIRATMNLVLMICIILFVSLWMWFSNRWQGTIGSRSLGTLPVLWLLTAVTTIYFPSITYLFSIPLFLQLVFIIYYEWYKGRYKTTIGIIMLSVSAIVIMILLTPITLVVYQALFVYNRFIEYAYYFTIVEAFFIYSIASPFSVLLESKKAKRYINSYSKLNE
ncbi:M20/M25/M40 family metallo-hydrolase [Clostridium sp. Marseille-P299]|uniref:M20/M25/M40 family metallo-hydrolase n=1 Tax=Clostridium sp. Marseille-P299 TaxID=1805477 RepID=UPI00082F08F3|nr:M20/M25/M40 family metallo-hydrolase [Clostridium sp. Marseille-P299]